MSQSYYTLRWNNHQSDLLQAFYALLQAETLVDVTLVCAESCVRAHKVVLSASSPFFQRIFAENPCKHPVIVLKDFSGWELQAIVDFMYKGEINVIQDHLASLLRVAESLQVRGLADHVNCADSVKDLLSPRPNTSGRSASSASPADFDHQRSSSGYHRFHRLPMTTTHTFLKDDRAESPVARRKQPRSRRLSGENMTPQNLTCHKVCTPDVEVPPMEKVVNHSMKKSRLEPVVSAGNVTEDKKKLRLQGQLIHSQHLLPSQMQRAEEDMSKFLTPDPSGSPKLDWRLHHQEFPSSRVPLEGHNPLPFPPIPASVSSLKMTAPHSTFFGFDSPPLFPTGLNGCRKPLLELTEPRTMTESEMKKLARLKVQQTLRSWTTADLTEALKLVWTKKMTIAQASRNFGIPYRSLTKYVQGIYGKCLNLDQLRKECVSEAGGVDLMNLAPPAGGMGTTGTHNNNNNNNSLETSSNGELQRSSSTDEHQEDIQQAHRPQQAHSVFNHFAHNFSLTSRPPSVKDEPQDDLFGHPALT